MRKLTLVIDGNYFMHRTLYVIPRTNGKLLYTDNDYVMYIRKLMVDFASTVRKFKDVVNRIVLVADSSSWRKDFYPDLNYKGQRVKDDSINWDNFSKAYDEFRSILKDKGVIVHRESGAEGDDLIYVWTKFLNLNGENCVIVSGDHDLLQLIDYNESTEAYTLFYAPSSTIKELGIYKNFNTWLTEDETSDVTDIFNIADSYKSDSIKAFYKNLIEKEKLEIKVVDINKFSFTKILMGDGGDNIPSIYTYTKNDRNYKISEKKAEKVYNKILETCDFNIDMLYEKDYRERFVDVILSELKIDKVNRNSILSKFELNVTVALLNNKSIPDCIVSNCLKSAEQIFNTQKSLNIGNLMSKDVILANTRFLDTVDGYNFDNTNTTIDIDKMFEGLFS